jgi:hypothetical protein
MSARPSPAEKSRERIALVDRGSAGLLSVQVIAPDGFRFHIGPPIHARHASSYLRRIRLPGPAWKVAFEVVGS